MSSSNELINRIFDHIEAGDTDKAVFGCLRLSRNIGDIFNTVIFLRELNPDEKQLFEIFYDEVTHLNEDAQQLIWKITGERWVKERTISSRIPDEKEAKTVLKLGIGEMQKHLAHLQKIISDLNISNRSGMGEYDSAVFTDGYDKMKPELWQRVSAITTVQERIRTRCLNYASRVEKQLKTQKKTDSFLSDVQNVVNNYFSAHSEETYRKLQKASNLVNSTNAEDFALLLTSVRRAIKAVADYFHSPEKGKVECSDGDERLMGNEQYLNRLHEYCSRIFKSSTSSELVQAELNYLMAFARKLDKIASKGVHSEVSSSEAKQGLVGLYMFLFNIIQKIEISTSNDIEPKR